MNKIDERISWYEQNSTNWYDDLVRIELEKIRALYDVYEDSTDEMFVNEMIEAFCKIIEHQRERINELESESYAGTQYLADDILAEKSIPEEGFQNDKQLQEVFTAYCLNDGKSSYTVNDYCSRIKNLWKSFLAEYTQDASSTDLKINREKINRDTPLLNAFYHTQELNYYIGKKIAESEGNRNWANTRAAFNKFNEFKSHC